MRTQKYKKLSLNFHSSLNNKNEPLIKTPKLSTNNSSINILKNDNKLNELKLPSIKCFLNSNISTLHNSSIDTDKISLKLKKNKNSIFDQIEKKEPTLKRMFGNKFKNYSKEKDKRKNNSLNLNGSTPTIFLKNFKKFKLKKELNFHRQLMSNNLEKINSYIENGLNEEENKEDEYLKNIGEDPSKKPPKTGIFGPRNNIINIIRAEMERLKYDNIYKGVDNDLKELIKDEIMDAQVKLKRKPENLVFNKKLEKALYLSKMEKYKYIESMNKIRQINQIANTSVIEEDGNIMKRLANDAYDYLIHNRGINK